VRRIALIELADLEDPTACCGWSIAWWSTRPRRCAPKPRAARSLGGRTCGRGAVSGPDRSSPAVQAAAAQSLSLLKSEAAGRVILPWTGHADIGVRIAAFRALRELRFPVPPRRPCWRWTITTPTSAAKRSACWAGSSSSMPAGPGTAGQ
jgi:HEAT repeat protein